MRRWRHVIVLVLAIGCQPLGDGPCPAADGGHPDGEAVPIGPSCTTGCDEAAARAIVHDGWGRAMYAGQAVLFQSCAGAGGLCHAGAAVDRRGAPFQLDYDLFPVRLPSESGLSSETELERLAELQRLVVRTRQTIWAAVIDERMPPGLAGDESERLVFGWVTDPAAPETDVPVPSVRTPLGREILRNWLACRAPVVERYEVAVAPSCASDGECASRRCADGICVAVGEVALRLSRPLSPTWTAIFAQVIEPGCLGSLCHGTSVVRGAATAGGLDLFERTSAREHLVGVVSASTDCAGETLVGADAASSLLFAKLDPARTDRCGERMPPGPALPPEVLTAIRTWIDAGGPE